MLTQSDLIVSTVSHKSLNLLMKFNLHNITMNVSSKNVPKTFCILGVDFSIQLTLEKLKVYWKRSISDKINDGVSQSAEEWVKSDKVSYIEASFQKWLFLSLPKY